MPFAPPVDLGPDPTAPIAPVAPVVPAPVVAPPAPAPDAATGAYWNQFRQAYKDLPLAQAQTAINAAMKYQGIRGYQRDLAAGKPAAEALARWGPLMLSSDRGAGGLAGAAAMTRAATPPTHFGTRGEVLQVLPNGTVRELRQPNVATPEELVTKTEGGQTFQRRRGQWYHVPSTAASGIDRIKAQGIQSQLNKIEEGLNKMDLNAGPAEVENFRYLTNKKLELKRELQMLQNPAAIAPAPGTVPTVPAPASAPVAAPIVAAPALAATTPRDMVPVINPAGKRVRIRKSQLQDALAQGYTQP